MGIFSKVGGFVNDILGGTSSAKKAQQYALQQQQAQNSYNKETMQNMHQWEVADLKAAGLNPALGYGGSTSGIATGTASGPQAGTGDPVAMIANAMGIGNTMREMELKSASTTAKAAEAEKTAAETAGIIAKNKYIDENNKHALANTMADTAVKTAEAANKNEERNLIKEETKYTKERARGYSVSETRSTGSGYWGLSHNTARSLSRTH